MARATLKRPGSASDVVLPFRSANAWAAWLAKHHASSRGLWLKFAKKAAGIETVTYAEALDVALCYGWIDGLVKRFDEQYYLQRFTPRRPRSKWSRINCGKATRLIEEGKMKPAGLRQVESARSDGRWSAAYDSPKTATMPADFRRALEKRPIAMMSFSSLTSRNRFAILYHIHDARKPETRARRIARFVSILAKGKGLQG
jgi:uncharacterized protein YdeI (YjbR/CyaY-like superfamily)